MSTALAPAAASLLREGGVIPAHPLALTARRELSEPHQRALTRHYLERGCLGVAVAVHTTQFELRDHGLLPTVLRLAREECDQHEARTGRRSLRIAGVLGRRDQALAEARLAREEGYDLGLLSLAALDDADESALIDHCREVGEQIPLFGFYLQPAVGGRPLSRAFWRSLAELPCLKAIKVAPFDRYATLDVIEAVLESSRWQEVCLYTGNDDHIVLDLLGQWSKEVDGETRRIHFVGGLLGHWAVWTESAVALFQRLRAWRASGDPVPRELLALADQVTAQNGALFDAAHGFAGCLAGIQHVLHSEGRIPSPLCLSPRERMSPGQAERIEALRPGAAPGAAASDSPPPA